MEEVILEEYRDIEFEDFMRSKMEFPCVVLEGISSNEEIVFFRRLQYHDGVCVPSYCMVGEEPVSLGKLDLTLDGLLTLRGVFDYKVSLYKSADVKVDLDLNDPEVLMKFIKLI